MKTSKLIAAAALSVLAAAGAVHAETYEGVHPLTIANSRAVLRVSSARAVARSRAAILNCRITFAV